MCFRFSDQYLGVELTGRSLSRYRFNFLTHYQSFPKWLSVSSVTQLCPTLCDPMDCSTPGFPVQHELWSLLKLMSTESVIPSNHLILCRPPFLPPSIFPSISVFSNESVLWIRWPKYWSFSFSVSPANEYSGLISFRMDWLDLLAVQEILESSSTPQFFGTQLSLESNSHIYTWLLEKP